MADLALRYRAGVTARGPADKLARRRHAYTSNRASMTGRNVRARCGASILPLPLLEGRLRFDPEHRRACPRCALLVKAETRG